MLGKIEDKWRRGWQRTRCLDGITDSVDMNLSKLGKIVKNRTAWCAAVHGRGGTGSHTTEQLDNTSKFCETSIILIEKSDKKLPRKDAESIPHEHR